MTALQATSDTTRTRLETLVALVRKWNPTINLVAPSTLENAWDRHIADSACLVDLVPPPQRWADLGSGAGFPGLVVAILLAERSPATRVTLVESDGRKAAFLHTAARTLDVSIDVRNARIEALAPLDAQVVSARALAPLDRLFPLALRILPLVVSASSPRARAQSRNLHPSPDHGPST